MDLLDSHTVNQILCIPIGDVHQMNKTLWKGSYDRNFSMKDWYLQANKHKFNCGSKGFWNSLWNAKIHERLKSHLWRMATNSFPIGQNLKEWMGIGDRTYAMCGVEVEDAMHIFKHCQVIRALVFTTSWDCRIDAWFVADMRT